jgi:hypothetical protein
MAIPPRNVQLARYCLLPAVIALLLPAAVAVSLPAAAGGLGLAHRFQPGHTYQLSVSSETRTDASARGPDHPSFHEEVVLDYEATVVVLATDAGGRPVRELHRDVSVSFTRPDETASLFTEPVSFEVERVDGEVRISIGGERMVARIERLLREPLGRAHDRSDLAAWLEPGGPVEVGRSWPLDADFAKRLLRDRGLAGATLSGDPTATLEQREDGLSVHYAIPVSRARLQDLPPSTSSGRSKALLEGWVGVPDASGKRAFELTSNLVLDAGGAVHTGGITSPFGWKLRREERIAQRVRLLPQVATGR